MHSYSRKVLIGFNVCICIYYFQFTHRWQVRIVFDSECWSMYLQDSCAYIFNQPDQPANTRKPCWPTSFLCPPLSWSNSLDQHQTSFNQHKPAFWSFQHMCWGKVSVWVLPTAELFGRLRAVWHMHIECSNSYGSNLPALERLAHAVLKYLDWTWWYITWARSDTLFLWLVHQQDSSP